MALLTLDVPIEVKIQENGKIREILKITFRYPTKDEEKKEKELLTNIKKIITETEKISRKSAIINKKIEYAEKKEDWDKAEKLLNEEEKLERELEKLEEELKKIIGNRDPNEYAEEIAKRQFDVLVGGEDKEKLREVAEIKGYKLVLDVLAKERDKLEKKQNGE